MRRRIYTRGGDGGLTSLCDGTRVSKGEPICEVCGALDEANAFVGAALSITGDSLLRQILTFASHRLYNATSSLASAGVSDMTAAHITEADVAFLEDAIDHMSDAMAPLDRFILPTGTSQASFLHIARAVVRRAERRVVALGRADAMPASLLKFINRLSDLLFTAARYANHIEGDGDICWNKDQPIPELGPTKG